MTSSYPTILLSRNFRIGDLRSGHFSAPSIISLWEKKQNHRIFEMNGPIGSKFGAGCLLSCLYLKRGVGEASDLSKVIRGQ